MSLPDAIEMHRTLPFDSKWEQYHKCFHQNKIESLHHHRVSNDSVDNTKMYNHSHRPYENMDSPKEQNNSHTFDTNLNYESSELIHRFYSQINHRFSPDSVCYEPVQSEESVVNRFPHNDMSNSDNNSLHNLDLSNQRSFRISVFHSLPYAFTDRLNEIVILGFPGVGGPGLTSCGRYDGNITKSPSLGKIL